MAYDNLSEGALKVIMSGGDYREPIMQVLNYKRIHSGGSSDKERYRVLLSDGLNTITHAMFTASCADDLESSGISEKSVIKLKKYITSIIDNAGRAGQTRVLLILNTELIKHGSEVGSVIGSPNPLTDTNTSNTPKKPSNPTSTNGSPSRAMNTVNANHNQTNESISSKIINPIISLSPYHNKWVIKARVASKSTMRSWSNSKGEGKLFSMDLMDETGEIRLTCFREIAEKFYDFVQVDKVYFISKCQIKPANKQFSTLKNDYEMTATVETVIEECKDEDDSVPKIKYDFVPIDKIGHMEVGTTVDVIGVCKEASDLQSFTAKTTGRELKKREVTLIDQSKSAISLTLWGQQAESFNGENNPVVVVKNAKLGEFGGGKNLSVMMSSQLKINPDIPECYKVKGWFDLEGIHTEVNNISIKTGVGSFNTPWFALRDVQAKRLGQNPKGDYYQFVGTVLLIRTEKAVYKACPTPDCNKKVSDLENGMYRCEKCNREFPNFKYRLLVSMNVADWSRNQWLSAFSNEAEKIIGYTSQEVGEKLDRDIDEGLKCIENGTFKRFLFKCRAKMEMYNDESKLKTVVVNVKPVDYEEYNKYLIERINHLIA